MEYAIFIAMVIVTIGFAWLWLIEQQKKEEKRSASEKGELSDYEAQPDKMRQ
jgi:preprotein translocase subunit YajC